MSTSAATWSEADTATACQIWADYQRQHDLSGRVGQAVGIDPISGGVWFGASAKDIVLRLEAQGVHTPLFFLRVGQDYYARKGGGR
jgi:hypothetical protein